MLRNLGLKKDFGSYGAFMHLNVSGILCSENLFWINIILNSICFLRQGVRTMTFFGIV